MRAVSISRSFLSHTLSHASISSHTRAHTHTYGYTLILTPGTFLILSSHSDSLIPSCIRAFFSHSISATLDKSSSGQQSLSLPVLHCHSNVRFAATNFVPNTSPLFLRFLPFSDQSYSTPPFLTVCIFVVPRAALPVQPPEAFLNVRRKVAQSRNAARLQLLLSLCAI